MKRSVLPYSFLLVFVTLLWSCGPGTQHGSETGEETQESTAAEEGPKTAVASISAASGSAVSGSATFTEEAGGVKMVLDVQGLTPGIHALHLHEIGDCSAEDASSAGGHWNPTDEAHGQRSHTDEFHRGDIVNLEAAADSTAHFEMVVEDWTIGGSEDSNIIGKAVIIHDSPDDFTSQPSGAAGARVGCGVIEEQQQM